MDNSDKKEQKPFSLWRAILVFIVLGLFPILGDYWKTQKTLHNGQVQEI